MDDHLSFHYYYSNHEGILEKNCTQQIGAVDD